MKHSSGGVSIGAGVDITLLRETAKPDNFFMSYTYENARASAQSAVEKKLVTPETRDRIVRSIDSDERAFRASQNFVPPQHRPKVTHQPTPPLP